MEAEIKFRKVKCSHPRRPRHRSHVAQSHFFCVSVIGKRHGPFDIRMDERQDQFVRAMVKKLTTYALGRPLVFGDRAAVDEIASRARRNGDGLATLVTAIATSELFRSR